MLHVVQKFIADAYASVVARVESPFFRTFEPRFWSKRLVSRCAIWSPFIVRAQENSRVKSRGTCFDWSVAKAGPPYVPTILLLSVQKGHWKGEGTLIRQMIAYCKSFPQGALNWHRKSGLHSNWITKGRGSYYKGATKLCTEHFHKLPTSFLW